MSNIIDGKKVAKSIKEKLKEKISELKEKTGNTPGLAVVLVGTDPASQTYVKSKVKSCEQVGIISHFYGLPEDTTERQLVDLIHKLNEANNINGILVQLPLPEQINESHIINEIDPEKDVDGFHPVNVGLLWSDVNDCLCPCTPQGIIELLQYYKVEISGKHVVIVGRSNIVGKPLAGLFLQRGLNATVTVCHSYTENLEQITQNADILVSAVGKPGMIKETMVKQNAVVIDVGIVRVKDETKSKGYRICGDVDFENVKSKASWITPVPGGVGPMTTTILLRNTFNAFKNNIVHL